jgi:hypothetical protein
MAEIENPSVVQPPTNSNSEPEWHAPVLISFESRDAENGAFAFVNDGTSSAS